MAVPTIAASETQIIGTAAASVNVAAPTGMTTGHLDVIRVVFRPAGASKTLLTPSGFTQLHQEEYGTTRNRVAVFYRSAEASPGSVTLQLSDGTDIQRAGISRNSIAGANLSSPIAVSAGGITAGDAAPNTSPTFTIPGLTTPEDDCLALAILMWGSSYLGGSDGSRFSVSGWTAGSLNRVIPTAGNASNITACTASKAISAAGPTGDAVFDPVDHSNTTSQPWVGYMFAIAPAAGGPPPAIVRPRIVIF